MSVGHSPTSASWVGSSDTDSSLERKLRMALKACGVARGRAGASRAPVSPRGQLGPTPAPSPSSRARPHLCPTWSRTDFSGSTVRPQSTGRILWAQSFIE